MAAAFAMIHAVAALRPLLNLWRRSPCGSSARLAPPSGGFSYRQGSIPVCVTRLARDPASRVRWGASYPPRAVPVSTIFEPFWPGRFLFPFAPLKGKRSGEKR